MHYRYELDANEIANIKHWDTTHWSDIIHKLLNQEAIAYNIDFGEPLGHRRVLEINALLRKYHINNDSFMAAAYRIFHESIRNGNKIFAYTITELFDINKPALYFERITSMLRNSEYDDFFDIPIQGEFSLRYRLINAIMVLDTNNQLLDYLLANANSRQPPEYFQVVIRYIYTNNGKFFLKSFMESILNSSLPAKSMAFLLLGFKEYVYTMSDFEMLYSWLSEDIFRFYKNRNDITGTRKILITMITNWINNEYHVLNKFKNYALVAGLLSPYNPENNYDVLPSILIKIFSTDSVRLKNIGTLCDFIGNQNPKMHLAEVIRSWDNNALIYLPNDPNPVEIDLTSVHVQFALESFEMGIFNFKSYSRQKSDWQDLLISDDVINLSMN